jgi:hypothetical protein
MAPTDAQISRAIDLASFDRLKSTEKKAGFREKPSFAKEFFRAGRAGEWRQTLTLDQVKQVVARHAAVMERYGYR